LHGVSANSFEILTTNWARARKHAVNDEAVIWMRFEGWTNTHPLTTGGLKMREAGKICVVTLLWCYKCQESILFETPTAFSSIHRSLPIVSLQPPPQAYRNQHT